MKKKLFVGVSLFILLLFIVSIYKINVAREIIVNSLDKQAKESQKFVKEPKEETLEITIDEKQEDAETIKSEEIQNEVEVQDANIRENASYEEPTSIDTSYTTRMTSFWANDGYGTGECTGSGKCSWDFQINEKGWYTWQGKLVVATATTYLANQGWYTAPGVHLYKYYEELVLTIDGVDYDAIILDSCGSSMKTDRIDLFVSNGSSARDATINVRKK